MKEKTTNNIFRSFGQQALYITALASTLFLFSSRKEVKAQDFTHNKYDMNAPVDPRQSELSILPWEDLLELGSMNNPGIQFQTRKELDMLTYSQAGRVVLHALRDKMHEAKWDKIYMTSFMFLNTKAYTKNKGEYKEYNGKNPHININPKQIRSHAYIRENDSTVIPYDLGSVLMYELARIAYTPLEDQTPKRTKKEEKKLAREYKKLYKKIRKNDLFEEYQDFKQLCDAIREFFQFGTTTKKSVPKRYRELFVSSEYDDDTLLYIHQNAPEFFEDYWEQMRNDPKIGEKFERIEDIENIMTHDDEDIERRAYYWLMQYCLERDNIPFPTPSSHNTVLDFQEHGLRTTEKIIQEYGDPENAPPPVDNKTKLSF